MFLYISVEACKPPNLYLSIYIYISKVQEKKRDSQEL